MVMRVCIGSAVYTVIYRCAHGQTRAVLVRGLRYPRTYSAQALRLKRGSHCGNMAEGYYQWTRTGPQWRPFVYRCKHRSHFAGQSGAANSGAIEPAEATPARTRDAETPQESSDASDASAAEPSAKVLLGIAELQRLQKDSGAKAKLHQGARSYLNEKIRFFAVSPADHERCLPIVAEDWPTWR